MQIIDTLGITPNAFASHLGYARSQTIYDILKGKSLPSFDFFDRFSRSPYAARFHTEWLVCGRGPMLKDGPAAADYAALPGQRISPLASEQAPAYQAGPATDQPDLASLLQTKNELIASQQAQIALLNDRDRIMQARIEALEEKLRRLEDSLHER